MGGDSTTCCPICVRVGSYGQNKTSLASWCSLKMDSIRLKQYVFLHMQRAPWLDWIRFTAAFMVMACHARGSNWVEWNLLLKADQTWSAKTFFSLTRAGMEWVVVFFVLSGFLVGGGVIRKTAERRFNLPQFAVDRASRIWVPLLPALLFSTVVAAICGITTTLGGLAGNLFGLQGVLVDNYGHNEPLWSLSYEIWFYVIAGALAVAITRKSWARLCAVASLIISVAVFTKLSPWLLLCWSIGALAIFTGPRWQPNFAALAGLSLALAGAAISQLQSGTNVAALKGLSGLLPSRDLALLIESIGVAILIGAMVRLPPTAPLMISVECAGPKLAAFSYTLYLTHYPVLSLWEHFAPSKYAELNTGSLLAFGMKIASCIALALAAYHLFESRTDMVRERFRKLSHRTSEGPVGSPRS